MASKYSNQPVNVVSANAGTEEVSFTGNTAQASSQECREVFICTVSDTIYLNYDATATSSSFPVPKITNAAPIRLPVDNTNHLYFYATDSDAHVYLLWRD